MELARELGCSFSWCWLSFLICLGFWFFSTGSHSLLLISYLPSYLSFPGFALLNGKLEFVIWLWWFYWVNVEAYLKFPSQMSENIIPCFCVGRKNYQASTNQKNRKIHCISMTRIAKIWQRAMVAVRHNLFRDHFEQSIYCSGPKIFLIFEMGTKNTLLCRDVL